MRGVPRHLRPLDAAGNFQMSSMYISILFESNKLSVKMKFSPSHCSHVVPYSLSLVEERGQVLSNGNQSVDPGSLVDKHLLWWMNTCLRIKEEPEGTEKNLQQTKAIKKVNV